MNFIQLQQTKMVTLLVLKDRSLKYGKAYQEQQMLRTKVVNQFITKTLLIISHNGYGLVELRLEQHLMLTLLLKHIQTLVLVLTIMLMLSIHLHHPSKLVQMVLIQMKQIQQQVNYKQLLTYSRVQRMLIYHWCLLGYPEAALMEHSGQII